MMGCGLRWKKDAVAGYYGSRCPATAVRSPTCEFTHPQPLRIRTRQCCSSCWIDNTECPSFSTLAGTLREPGSSSRTESTLPRFMETRTILLNEGEPLNNVPRTVTEQGHQVLSIRQEGGFHHVLIRKA